MVRFLLPQKLPVVVIARVVICASGFTANGLVLLAQDVDPLSTLGGIWRSHQVPRVVDKVRPGDTPFQHLGAELISVAEILKEK